MGPENQLNMRVEGERGLNNDTPTSDLWKEWVVVPFSEKRKTGKQTDLRGCGNEEV